MRTTLILCATLLAGTPFAQDRGKSPVPQVEDKADKSDKAKVTWPKIKPVRMSIAKDKIAQLAHKKESQRKRAHATIVRYGAGCAPALLGSLKPSQREEIRAEVVKLLDTFVEPRYAPLLAEAWTGKNAPRDRYILTTIRRLGLPGYIPLFAKGLVHGDPEIREISVFALAGAGDARALHPLLLLAKDSWDDKNYEIREVLPKLKGEKSTKWLLPRIEKGELSDRIAALRLLHGVGTEDSAKAVAPLLDAKEHLLRAAAVNALRGIVDGDPPFRKLSVFKAIEEIKRWKARVGR